MAEAFLVALFLSLEFLTHLLFNYIMSVRLYIGNLPFEVTREDLNTIFSTIGTVEDAIIVTQPGSGRPRGFGFVEMQDEQEAHVAIEQLDGYSLAGRSLKVNVANTRQD